MFHPLCRILRERLLTGGRLTHEIQSYPRLRQCPKLQQVDTEASLSSFDITSCAYLQSRYLETTASSCDLQLRFPPVLRKDT